MRDHILHACPGDCGAKGLLHEFDASPRLAKRWRMVEPMEPREPVAPIELVEPVAQVEHVAQVVEATVAKRQVVAHLALHQPAALPIALVWLLFCGADQLQLAEWGGACSRAEEAPPHRECQDPLVLRPAAS